MIETYQELQKHAGHEIKVEKVGNVASMVCVTDGDEILIEKAATDTEFEHAVLVSDRIEQHWDQVDTSYETTVALYTGADPVMEMTVVEVLPVRRSRVRIGAVVTEG